MFNFTSASGDGSVSPAVRFAHDFNVDIEDNPAGSTLLLEQSKDNGVTWKPFPRDGSDVTFTQRDVDLVENRQSALFRLRCTI